MNKCHVDSRWKTWHTGHGNRLFRVQLEEIEHCGKTTPPIESCCLFKQTRFFWVVTVQGDWQKAGVAANKFHIKKKTTVHQHIYVSYGVLLKFKVKNPENLFCFGIPIYICLVVNSNLVGGKYKMLPKLKLQLKSVSKPTLESNIL